MLEYTRNPLHIPFPNLDLQGESAQNEDLVVNSNRTDASETMHSESTEHIAFVHLDL